MMFGLTKQVFIGLLASIVNISNNKKCISLKSKQCKIQPTLINLQLSCVNQMSKIKRFWK